MASAFRMAQSAESTAKLRHWCLSGQLDTHSAAQLVQGLRGQWPRRGGELHLELTELQSIDFAGVATLVHTWRLSEAKGVTVRLSGVQPEVQQCLERYRLPAQPTAPEKPPGLLESLGDGVWTSVSALGDFLVLAADTTVLAAGSLVMPSRLRFAAVLREASRMGSQALGIVGLIAFLIGLTLAFQSAYQLRQFGAAIYVATLTAISMVREMGPLITAILVAGRSGSSITSEVATMKVGEEIDALHVMGIPFVDFIAVPKLLAMVVTVPLLTVFADVLGILGGWMVGMAYLDLAPVPYLQRSVEALVPKDLVTGLFKSVVFAWGIALIGLYYGMGVRGGAQEVGLATTRSVVSAIFFIIVADSLFSILFYVWLG